ncbi:hypothetical protein [Rhodococcus sp. SGAir0479]|uniref:hypothetical protein n=1 Tax=Rhodococcus sp. SGAir0479 TaxID=2567884 RepID=UPI0010CD06AF|nr:hypothetical protein [Rhodococcus sp. SGAir0479]QCQ93133.1 hypothetical protein E7742_19185 [Rhodococcus sp. SGAir0479]
MASTAPAAPTATAGIANSGIGIELTDAPGQADIVENPAPGTSITRHVRVHNKTGAAQSVSVYAGPASIVNETFSVEPAGETNALTSWTTIDKPTVRLDNWQFEDVAVVITVPPDAPSATLYGAIWAAIGGSRSGVRMDVTVGGDNGPAADFVITGIVPERRSEESVAVLATVANTGGRPIDIAGTLRLSDGPGAMFVNAVPAQPTRLAAGTTGTVLFVVPDSALLPDGPWTAKVRLKNGYFTHEFREAITFPDKPSGGGDNPTSSLGSLGSTGSFGGN